MSIAEQIQQANIRVERVERGVEVDISLLHPNPWNPNVMNNRTRESTKESLVLYTQVLDIVVRPHPDLPGHYQIVDGEHRYMESLKLGHPTVFAAVVYGLSNSDAEKLTVILNYGRGEPDSARLAQLLSNVKLDQGEDAILGLPYSPEEFSKIIDIASNSWETRNQPGNNNSQWVEVRAKVPREAMDVIQQAKALVEQQRGGYHADEAIAWGQFLESVSADYIAR